MDSENMQPVATVTGIYRGKFGGLEPLTVDTPLTRDEVRRNPIFYELDLHPEQGDENLIIDVIYDTMSPLRLQDLYRGTDIPRGVRFWPDWFDIPPYAEMRDVDGRRVYPRAPGIHTVQIRTGRRKWAQMGRVRVFSPATGGYTSPVFRFRIAEEIDV
jgi:hypothetical protein